MTEQRKRFEAEFIKLFGFMPPEQPAMFSGGSFWAMWQACLAAQPAPHDHITPEMVEAAEEAYMPFGDMELALRVAFAHQPAPQRVGTCNHRVVDARNPVVKSGYLCIDCGAVFAAADHDAPQRVAVAEGWKHDCAALLTNDVELWIDACPHCGKPRAAAPQPDGVGDVIQRAIDALQGCMCKSCEDDACCMSNVRQSRDDLRALLAKGDV